MRTYFVQSPDHPDRVYEVSAEERTNLTARGYIDVTERQAARERQPVRRQAPAPPPPSPSPGPPAQNPTEEARD